MSNPFQYSVLKYRPSYLLDERVNVGCYFTSLIARNLFLSTLLVLEGLAMLFLKVCT